MEYGQLSDFLQTHTENGWNACLDSHSDGTHSVSKWCNPKFIQICSNWEGENIFSYNIHYWVNYSFRCCNNMV